MQKVVIGILIILIALLLIEGVILFLRGHDLKKEVNQQQAKMQSLEKENNDLQAQVDYFSKPENLEKELKSKFNYRRPDEKMMIIVP